MTRDDACSDTRYRTVHATGEVPVTGIDLADIPMPGRADGEQVTD